MEIQKDGGVLLNYNETLLVCREMERKYKNSVRDGKRQQNIISYYQKNPPQPTSVNAQWWSERAGKRLVIAEQKMATYLPWHNVYELLMKNKRFKKEE